jgi:hypothetical protein
VIGTGIAIGIGIGGTIYLQEHKQGGEGTEGGEAAPPRSIDNPSSLEGATPEEVEEAAGAAGLTTKEPLSDGNGVKLSDPTQPGRTVQINKGYPGGTGVHGGPYAKITGNGPTVRVPLKGNPTLQ